MENFSWEIFAVAETFCASFALARDRARKIASPGEERAHLLFRIAYLRFSFFYLFYFIYPLLFFLSPPRDAGIIIIPRSLHAQFGHGPVIKQREIAILRIACSENAWPDIPLFASTLRARYLHRIITRPFSLDVSRQKEEIRLKKHRIRYCASKFGYRLKIKAQ